MAEKPWFKLWSKARGNAALLKLTPDEHFIWFQLICTANESRPRGHVDLSNIPELALDCHVLDAEGEPDAERLVLAIAGICRRFLAKRDGDDLAFPKWDELQYDKPSDKPGAVAERVRKHRELKRDVTRETRVTLRGEERREEKTTNTTALPGTSREGDGGFSEEGEARRAGETSRVPDDVPDLSTRAGQTTRVPDGFEDFWKAASKAKPEFRTKAINAWMHELAAGHSPDEMIAGAQRYTGEADREGTETRLRMNPVRFLTEQHFVAYAQRGKPKTKPCQACTDGWIHEAGVDPWPCSVCGGTGAI